MGFDERRRYAGDIHKRPLHITPAGVVLEERGPDAKAGRLAEAPDDFSGVEGNPSLEEALRKALPSGIGEAERAQIIAFLESIDLKSDGADEGLGGSPVEALEADGALEEPSEPERAPRLLEAIRHAPKVSAFLRALAVFYSLTAGTGTVLASDREMRDIYKAGHDAYDRRTAQFGVDRQLNGQTRFQQGIIDSERNAMELSGQAAMKRKEFIQGMYRFVDDLRAIEDDYRLNFERGMSQNFPNENARNQAEVRLNRTYLLRVIELENRIKILRSHVESAQYQAPKGLFSGNFVEKFRADMDKMMTLALQRSGETKQKFERALGRRGIVIPRNALDAAPKEADSESRQFGGAETLAPADRALLESLMKN